MNRRRLLERTVQGFVAAGAGFVLYPFLKAWAPTSGRIWGSRYTFPTWRPGRRSSRIGWDARSSSGVVRSVCCKCWNIADLHSRTPTQRGPLSPVLRTIRFVRAGPIYSSRSTTAHIWAARWLPWTTMASDSGVLAIAVTMTMPDVSSSGRRLRRISKCRGIVSYPAIR